MKYISFMGLEHEVTLTEIDELYKFTSTLEVNFELEYHKNCVYAVIELDPELLGTMYLEMEFSNYSWEEYYDR